MGQGNRGMAFEKLINLSNEMYQRGSRAYKQAFNSSEGVKK
ncbi:recombinase RecU [Bacillus cereus]|nr:recombinase RecU [Bacillus cereus]PFI44362.1 recombinase RecU [Bacillus cereus]PFS00479.1 recombinase RecU [Bacillus cereus]PGS18581.1 recombinase RecU [Bacillus cereus]